MPDRNPKVRRRLAQGKLRLRLCDLRNLGPQSERLLAAIGIHDVEALRRRGALEAYLAVRHAGLTRSLNLLWALVGALEPWPEGRDWREVAASEARLPLLLAVESRVTARRSALEAGGVAARVGQSRPKRSTSRPPTDSDDRVWVPGLPFETRRKSEQGKTPKKKNRR
ncbi:MAG: TfoX/Sxy family protein [Gammaproteobacteria bacterium]|jgi:DNA transformation protein